MCRLRSVLEYYVKGKEGIRKEVGISEVLRVVCMCGGGLSGGLSGGESEEGEVEMDVEEYHKYIFGNEELNISLYSRYL